MVSGFVPARRATRVEPVTAMRDSRHARASVTCASGGSSARSCLMGLGLLVAVLRACSAGSPRRSPPPRSLGLGAVLMMFGFAFLAPLLVRPLARVLGAPLGAGRG